jgi:hypothetical protein
LRGDNKDDGGKVARTREGKAVIEEGGSLGRGVEGNETDGTRTAGEAQGDWDTSTVVSSAKSVTLDHIFKNAA